MCTLLVVVPVALAQLLPLPGANDQDLSRRRLPPLTDGHLFGTDQLGRDLLSRVLHGGQVSLSIGVLAVLVSGLIGIAAGPAAGYFGRWVDAIVSRLLEAQMSLPLLMMLLLVVALFGPSVTVITCVIAIAQWPEVARLTRSPGAGRTREAVRGRRPGAGPAPASPSWPGTSSPTSSARRRLVVLLLLAQAVLLESALSYLGAGPQRPFATWGRIISDGQDYITTSWWLVTLPGLVIALLVVGVNLLGDGLRDRTRRRATEGADEHVTSDAPPATATDRPPLLEVEDLQIELITDARRGPRGRRRRLHPRRGRDRHPHRRVRLRQVHHRDGPAAAAARGAGRAVRHRPHPGRRRRRRPRRGPPDPRPRRLPHPAGPDDRAQPGPHHRPPARRGAAHPPPGLSRADARAAASTARPGTDPQPRDPAGGPTPTSSPAACSSASSSPSRSPPNPSCWSPTSRPRALDVTVQAGVLDLLMELQERTGIGILMITHDLGVARLVSDRIHVMRDGRFVESGPVEQIVEHPAEAYTRNLLAAVPTLGPWDETRRPRRAHARQ